MLNDKQRKVALELSGNTIVSASPGTGKTKTLVARAQHKLDAMPKHKSLALITYTNAGADEISSRLITDDKNVFVGTIHRFCLEFILRPFGWIYEWHKPKIVSYDELNQFIEESEIDLGTSPLDELNKIKRTLDGSLDISVTWEHAKSIQNIAQQYFQFLSDRNSIDFNEILYRSYKIISENNFVVQSLASKFFEISIDEFQDTNAYQYEILKAINSKHECTFFIVGDEKQMIYRFAGAIDDAFSKALIDFDTTLEYLDVTYRSTQNIVNAFSTLYENHPVLQNESNHRDDDGLLSFIETDNNTNNSSIETVITNLIGRDNIDIAEIAILTNSWRDAFFISRHLRQRYQVVGLGALPHRNSSSTTFSLIKSVSRFYLQPSIKNLRIIKRNIELHSLENNFTFSANRLSYATNQVISNIISLNKSIPLIQGLEQLKSILDSAFLIEHSSIDEIIELIDEVEANNWTLEKYIHTISGVAGITVNTIHQAKGLEYDAVILNGVNEGNIPFQLWDPIARVRHPLTSENLIDGRAKLYVGVSRAKKKLFITHNWRPSMFISDLQNTQ